MIKNNINIFKYIIVADAGIVVLQKNDIFKTVYPNKMFDYMSCKKPVLMGVDGIARELIEKSNSGYYFEPSNAVDLAKKSKKISFDNDLCLKMGENGFHYIRKYFDREKLSREYIDLINKKMTIKNDSVI